MHQTPLVGRLRIESANVMVDEHELSSVLSDFARTLIGSFPLQANLDSLIARVVDVLPATSAGITLITSERSPRHIAASDDAAVRYEQLQTALGQGPCLLAYDSGIAVAVPDICADDRFPLFGPAAYEEGLGAVFTFPLRHGEGRMGALDVYRDTPGPFDLEDMEAAQTLADVVSACLTLRSAPLGATDDFEFQRLGVAEGIAERRAADVELRRSEELHRSAIETMSEGLYVLGVDGRLLGSNAAARRLLDAEPGDFERISFVHEDGSVMDLLEHPAAMALRGGSQPETVVGVLDECGERRWLATSARALRRAGSGRPWAAVCTVSDVTEQRNAVRANQESLSVVSHEMRTPLTSIKGALDLMAAGATGDLTDPVQRMVRVAAANTERLLSLVNSLLDLARIESGPGGLTFGRADLSNLIRRSVDMMSPLAERADVRVVFRAPDHHGPMVDVDGDRLIQTFTNVLSNAVKFSPSGSVVSIVVDASSMVGAVEVRVIDHGRGVPPDLLEDVFARFHQTEAADARSGTGTGLGLAICRSIVEGHHGKIWLEPTPGGGATCVFTLPLPAADPGCGPLGAPG